jgi:TPR repeat protein
MARSIGTNDPPRRDGYALSLARQGNDDGTKREVAQQLGRAAAAGLPTAMYLLAGATEQGAGTERDESAAAELYRRAAEKGHIGAQTRWGLALMKGHSVLRDVVVGETWLRRAALSGDAEAAAFLGNYYSQSGPALPNYPEAAGWYRRAADAGINPRRGLWARFI